MFTADNGTNGTEWWITQGTTSSTQLLKDIRIGTGSASEGFYPQGIALSNTRAVFSANDGPNGAELWITDGTTSGTRLLKNINVVGASSFHRRRRNQRH